MRITVARSLDQLAPHAAAWDRLLLRQSHPTPQLSHAWVATLLEHDAPPGTTWRCWFAYRGEHLAGVLAAVARPHRLFGRRCPRLRAPENRHTRIGEPLLDPDGAREALAIEWYGLREGSPTLAALGAGLPGYIALRAADERGSLARTGEGLAAFRAKLSPNFAGNLRKARNKLARLSDADFAVVADPALADAAFDRFVAVEAAGWKGAAGSAIGSSPARGGFFRALARRLAANGWLEWHFLLAGGRPIAGHFAARIGPSLALIKIGYDEGFARYAPGNLLFERTIERACADGSLAEVNCLTDMAWHRNWRLDRAAYERVWRFPARPLALLGGYLPTRCRLLARRWLTPLRGRWRARKGHPARGQGTAGAAPNAPAEPPAPRHPATA